jgi:hypothetical protein
MVPLRMIKMFMKKEAYAEPKDPRPISTINGVDKGEYSKFIYTFSDHLKTCQWYAFGKTPKEIAERVCAVLEGAKRAVNTDLSRFDGRVSQVLRELEKLILMRAFHPSYHSQLLELHRSQYCLHGVGTFGTEYETDYTRCSGSPETAAFNSAANAFMAFLALRTTRRNGAFLTPAQAYASLGIYGGDDGMTADVDPAAYVKSCASVGQKLTVEEIKRGEFGIKFLARVYGPHVWFGDTSSCCDLPRQLSKFHSTIVLPPNVTPQQKLVEKCRSLFLSDPNTPILGELSIRVIACIGGIPEPGPAKAIAHWNSFVDSDSQYPNERGDWMEAYCKESIPGVDLARFRRWLSTCTELNDFLKPPLLVEPKPAKSEVPVVVDDDILPRSYKPVHQKPSKGKPSSKPKGGNGTKPKVGSSQAGRNSDDRNGKQGNKPPRSSRRRNNKQKGVSSLLRDFVAN